MLKKAEELQTDPTKLVEFAAAASAVNIVLSWNQDEEIVFTSKDFSPNTEHFVVSIPGNKFRTTKPIYVTNGPKNEFLYSLDNKTWYRTRNDNEKKIENLHIDFFYDISKDKNNKRLSIVHRTAAKIGANPVPESFRNKRTIVPLEAGKHYSHTDKKMVNVNLDDNILYLPPGTILKGNLILTGNLLFSRLSASQFNMKALRDLFLYRKGFMFAVSFNNRDWNNGLLSFDIDFAMDLYSPEKGALEMDVLLGLKHKPSEREDKRVSMEIYREN